MKNSKYLPYSDERLSRIMGLEPSELKFLPVRDEIKRIVKDYNLFLKPDIAISELTELRSSCTTDKVAFDAITRLISCIKLR